MIDDKNNLIELRIESKIIFPQPIVKIKNKNNKHKFHIFLKPQANIMIKNIILYLLIFSTKNILQNKDEKRKPFFSFTFFHEILEFNPAAKKKTRVNELFSTNWVKSCRDNEMLSGKILQQ